MNIFLVFLILGVIFLGYKKIKITKNLFINYLIFIFISTPKLLFVVNISFFKIP